MRLGDDDDATAPLQQPSSSTSSAPEFHASAVQCFRGLHPYCQAPPPPSHLPFGTECLPSVYPQHASSPSIRGMVSPSAPLMPPSDEMYPYYPRTPFDGIACRTNGNDVTCDSSDMLRVIPRGDPSSVDDHNSICLQRIPEDHRTNADAILQHVYCACAAFAVDHAHCRCNCDVNRALSVAHAHVPCADCLPPAYESIQKENDAQS